jgi:hypothetical protein
MFRNERGDIIDTARVETTEQNDAAKYILPGDIVLELGARYGTVTYQIHKALKGVGIIVAVEPDPSVWSVLRSNLRTNGCMDKRDPTQPLLIPGVISRSPQTLVGTGYGARTVPGAGGHITITDLYSKYRIPPFTVIVADCEGCLSKVLVENSHLLDSARLVLFEADGKRCENAHVRTLLRNAGFSDSTCPSTRPLWDYFLKFHSVWIKKVKSKPFSKLLLERRTL